MFTLLSFIFLASIKTTTFYFLNKNKTVKQSILDSLIFVPKIVFQQLVLFFCWYVVVSKYDEPSLQYGTLTTAFVLPHFYLFTKLNKRDASFILVSSIFGGILFTYLYHTFELGLVYAFHVHLGYHICLDIIFIFLGLQPMRLRK